MGVTHWPPAQSLSDAQSLSVEHPVPWVAHTPHGNPVPPSETPILQ
jgi:hypothetical protein